MTFSYQDFPANKRSLGICCNEKFLKFILDRKKLNPNLMVGFSKVLIYSPIKWPNKIFWFITHQNESSSWYGKHFMMQIRDNTAHSKKGTLNTFVPLNFDWIKLFDSNWVGRKIVMSMAHILILIEYKSYQKHCLLTCKTHITPLNPSYLNFEKF